MMIYRMDVPGGGDWVGLDGHDDWDVVSTLREAGPIVDSWRPLPAHLYRKVGDKLRPLVGSRLPCLGVDVLVLRDEAIEAIGPLVAPFAELLWLSCPDADLMLVHVTTVLDALDEDKAEIVRYPDSDGILDIPRYKFKPEVIETLQVFRLSQDVRGPTLFTADVVRSIEAFGFGGTIFRPVGEAVLRGE